MNACKLSFLQCLAAVAAVSATAGAAAQTDVALSERDYLEELPVVLSVSRLAQPLDEAPGAVTVIDREMIRQSGARDVFELFRLVPGFQVAKPSNSAALVTYHGLAESYPRGMQVLLDGRSMYSPLFYSGVNWDLIPVALDDIERIEVVRGSNSAAYGANAFLGIANIITRHAADTHGATAEVRDGNQGVRDRFVRLGGGDGTVDFRLSAQTEQDDGIVSIPDQTRKRLLDGRADIRLGLRDELQVQFGAIDTALDVGTVGKIGDPARVQQLSHQYVSVGWRRALDDAAELSVRFYHTEERGVDAFSAMLYDALVPPGDPLKALKEAVLKLRGINNSIVTVDYGSRTQRDNLELQHTFTPWPNARLVWGGELRSDSVVAPQFYGTPQAVSAGVARLFGNLEWRLTPAWIANVGGTVEHDSNAGTSSAPRVSLNWHVVPGQTLRAGVSSAFRSPSLFETRGDAALVAGNGFVLGNAFLATNQPRPERLLSRELGWLGEFKEIGLTADVRAFDEQVTDHIVTLQTYLVPPYCPSFPLSCTATDNSASAPSSYNAQDVDIRGIEYQLRWQPAAKTHLILNQSFVRLFQQFHLPDNPLAITQQLAITPLTPREILQAEIQANASAPTRNTTAMLMQQLPGGFNLSAIYSAVGAVQWTSNTRVPSYTRLDWRLAYPFRIGPTRGELAFAVQGDGAHHAEYRPDEVLAPRGYVTLRLEY
ncbi:MAG: TonB-dependent receptor [Rhodocyclaceae bacterium]|nr:TonB-dependent receptor [Rhodocyclaceae bacterium]